LQSLRAVLRENFMAGFFETLNREYVRGRQASAEGNDFGLLRDLE
jgi:hypothetical protein